MFAIENNLSDPSNFWYVALPVIVNVSECVVQDTFEFKTIKSSQRFIMLMIKISYRLDR